MKVLCRSYRADQTEPGHMGEVGMLSVRDE